MAKKLEASIIDGLKKIVLNKKIIGFFDSFEKIALIPQRELIEGNDVSGYDQKVSELEKRGSKVFYLPERLENLPPNFLYDLISNSWLL